MGIERHAVALLVGPRSMLPALAPQLPPNAGIQAAFRTYRGRGPRVALELLDATAVKAFHPRGTETQRHRENVRLRGASAAGEVLLATSGSLPLGAGMSSLRLVFSLVPLCPCGEIVGQAFCRPQSC